MVLQIHPKRIPKNQSPNRIPIPIRPMRIQLPTSITPIHSHPPRKITYPRNLYIIPRPHKMHPLQRSIGYQPRPSARFRTVRYDVSLCISYCRVGSGAPETEIVGVV